MKIRTLLVDDQSTGLAVLRDMLHFEPDIEIIGTAASGPEAVEVINRLAPDLVFLDVQMPELDGFGVVAQIKLPQMPVIIFVTGHDDYALKAFEAHALDYLIKPCQMVRLRSAVQRARKQIQSNQSGEIQKKLERFVAGPEDRFKISGAPGGQIQRPHRVPETDRYRSGGGGG